VHEHPRRRCHHHRHCHPAGKQGTGDDAKASLPALLLLSTRTSIQRCHCHRHHVGKQGTGDDAKASLPALLPLLTCTSVHTTAATTIARASEGQVTRHHRPPCCCHRHARLSLPPIHAIPPTAFHRRLQPLLIVEYVTFILARTDRPTSV
jgi:hypothetical protein